MAHFPLFMLADLTTFFTELPHQQLITLGLLIAMIVCLATLVNTNFGLSILVFMMLLSPEIEVAQLPERAVTIRIEDFLIGVVFFTWLAKMALIKEIGLFRRSVLNRPMVLYLFILTFSTLIALQQGTLRAGGSYFYLLKYAEYFVIFFMFYNNVTSKEQVQKFLAFSLFTGLCVYLYVLSTIGKYSRLGAPFEGDHPEPGSLGGYLLVQIAILLGLILHAEWPKHRILLYGLFFLSVVTLVMSTSRGAMLAFPPLYVAAIILSPRHRVQLVAAVPITLLIGYPFVPPGIIHWFLQAFHAGAEGGKAYQIGAVNVELGPSGKARIDAWQHVYHLWCTSPIIGKGIVGVGIVDSQFMRTLGEVGVVGIAIFLWLLAMVFKAGYEAYKSNDSLTRALGVGVLLANVGLIVQGLSANSYIIVRIMEPFWFLVAMALGMTRLVEEEAKEKVTVKTA